jgi:hypothetical protein
VQFGGNLHPAQQQQEVQQQGEQQQQQQQQQVGEAEAAVPARSVGLQELLTAVQEMARVRVGQEVSVGCIRGQGIMYTGKNIQANPYMCAGT